MREIKFRTWHDGLPVYFGFHDLTGWDDGGVFVRYNYPCVNDPNEKDYVVVIEQFTGLKDKNGREIYHNDLLRDQFGFVKRVESYFAEFILMDHDVSYKLMDYAKMAVPGIASNLEVIGNIRENPELGE